MGEAAHQTGWPGLRVGTDRNVFNGHAAGAGLDQGFKRIRILAQYQCSQGSLAADRPEAARGVRRIYARRPSDYPTSEALQLALKGGEGRECGDAAIADDDVGSPLQDRLDEQQDVFSIILIVCIGVDN